MNRPLQQTQGDQPDHGRLSEGAFSGATVFRGDEQTVVHGRNVTLNTYSLREILNGQTTDGQRCPVSLANLSGLINMQAGLHHATYQGDERTLRKRLEDQGDRIRGFVIHGENFGTAAYCIYFPMIDHKGRRVAYAEDFYVTEQARGKGVFKLLMHELANRAKFHDRVERIQWATDGRNEDVHAVVQGKFKAIAPNVVTLDANGYLSASGEPIPNLGTAWADANGYEYVTKELGVGKLNYPELPHELGVKQDNDGNWRNIMESTIVNEHGGAPFRGFATFRREAGAGRNAPQTLVAITPVWAHFSTFRLQNGAYAEHTRYGASVGSYEEKAAIQTSIAGFVPEFGQRKGLSHFKFHTPSDSDTFRIQTELLGLEEDRMLESDARSALKVYILTNGNFEKLAVMNVPNVITIGANEPIGNRRNGGSAPTSDRAVRAPYF